jgi:hypothetical protein
MSQRSKQALYPHINIICLKVSSFFDRLIDL